LPHHNSLAPRFQVGRILALRTLQAAVLLCGGWILFATHGTTAIVAVVIIWSLLLLTGVELAIRRGQFPRWMIIPLVALLAIALAVSAGL
jgi:hypothetical protein